MKQIVLKLSFFVLLFCGCGKFNDGLVNYVDFPNHPPRIASTLIINQDSNDFTAMVTSSSSVDDSDGPQIITDAVITITDNSGEVIYTLDSSNFVDSLYTINLPAGVNIPDGDIHLYVDAPGLDSVSATTAMPSTPIVEVQFFPNVDTVYSPWGSYVRGRFDFDIQNNVNISESFMVRVNATYLDPDREVVYPSESLWLESFPDPRLTDIYSAEGIIISDATVSSNSQGLEGLSIYVETNEKPGYLELNSISVKIESLSPSLAKHYESVETYYNSQDNIFAEPNLMYSNIIGGFGCFGMANTLVVEIKP